MAKWVIERAPGRGNGKLRLFYHNLQTDQRYFLGAQASDVPDEMVVEWVVKFGHPALDDLIVLPDGNELLYTSGGLRVHNDLVRLDDGRTVKLEHSVAV